MPRSTKPSVAHIRARALKNLEELGIDSVLDESIRPRQPPNLDKPDQKLRVFEPLTRILDLHEYPDRITTQLERLTYAAKRRDKSLADVKAALLKATRDRKKGWGFDRKVREILVQDVNKVFGELANMPSQKRAAESPPAHEPAPKRVNRTAMPANVRNAAGCAERIICHNSSVETDRQSVEPEDEQLGTDYEPDTDDSIEDPDKCKGIGYPGDCARLDHSSSDTDEDEEDDADLPAKPQQMPEPNRCEQVKHEDKGDEAHSVAIPEKGEQQQSEEDDADDEGEEKVGEGLHDAEDDGNHDKGETGETDKHDEGTNNAEHEGERDAGHDGTENEDKKEKDGEDIYGATNEIDEGSGRVVDEEDKRQAEPEKE
ncbi:hypothetical protein HDK77DRAFT_479279 [Phyllosticta capitalensis]|uniref:Uncharacterized protein n=1 Tax=Phyllosticta capitalensis TaxID=121624 RepID=A0ABR1YUB8_9PEZI